MVCFAFRLIICAKDYATFDIISDLTFGEPLYCLRDSVKHSWVSITFKSITATGLNAARNKHFIFRWSNSLRSIFQDNSVAARARLEFFERARDQVSKRLAKLDSEKGVEKPDFFTHIVNNQEKEATRMTRDEMDSNAVTFLVAGSETTATTLSGATHFLLRNPSAYTKLAAEIRSRFSSPDEITMEEVNKLEYLIAVFQETLRLYPPVATGFPRVVPAGGDNISGHYIPGGTSVYCSQHAMYHSERNFKDPELFVPERWLGEERYKDDKRSTLNPFSFGPRNCLGKKYVYLFFSSRLPSCLATITSSPACSVREDKDNHRLTLSFFSLAYAEMRLILAKIVFAFDLELVEKERDWMGEQKVFTLWDKSALMVKIKPVQR
jgi:cytochrome P450